MDTIKAIALTMGLAVAVLSTLALVPVVTAILSVGLTILGCYLLVKVLTYDDEDEKEGEQ